MLTTWFILFGGISGPKDKVPKALEVFVYFVKNRNKTTEDMIKDSEYNRKDGSFYTTAAGDVFK